jgi:hypothetical protein
VPYNGCALFIDELSGTGKRKNIIFLLYHSLYIKLQVMAAYPCAAEALNESEFLQD